MRNRMWFTWLAVVSMLATACADAITLAPQPAVQSPIGLRLTEATGETPGEPWPARIRSAGTTFLGSETIYTNYTEIKAWMNYDGFDASIAVKSTVVESSGTVIQTDHPVEEDPTNTLGRNEFHSVSQPLSLQSSCGAFVTANVQFKAWYLIPNLEAELVHFDEQATGRTASARQDPCAPCPAGMTTTGSEADGGSDSCTEDRDEPQAPGGGGGGGPCPECVEQEQPTAGICRVRYWYKTQPFQVYDAVILWCA